MIIEKLKKETNFNKSIIYREIKINNELLYIIYFDPLISSNSVSDFIIKSIVNIKYKRKNTIKQIFNNISNFKVEFVYDYEKLCLLLNSGFTIITDEKEENIISLETKKNLARTPSPSDTENSLRGSKDSLTEDYQTNIGLVKKRIKTNNLWIKDLEIGDITKTKIGILYINNIVNKEILKELLTRIKSIDVKGIVDSGTIKKEIDYNSNIVFPTIYTTERTDIVSHALLKGKIVIIVDNGPYALILPNDLNDFIISGEDYYTKNINVSFTRALKYLAFFISMTIPAIYIALITYNQEIIPNELLISFATQRSGVPFPAFFEAFLMIIVFEILKESDLRVPSFTGSSLSIVGALILGEAAVNAGIVSPILIIIVALTAICSLSFSEPDLMNGLRWYRILFMIGASLLGIVGVVIIFIFFSIKMISIESFGVPYLTPYFPPNLNGLKDSIIKIWKRN